MSDTIVRDCLRSAAWAARKRGDVRDSYTPDPSTCAGLLLERAKGDPAEALKLLVQMAHYLRAVQKEGTGERVFDDDTSQSDIVTARQLAEWDEVLG